MLRKASKLLLPLLALGLFAVPGRAAAQTAGATPTGTNSLVIRGDVNGDGQVTVLDALAVLAHVVGKALPSNYEVLPNADANGDGQVTAMDALVIAGYAMGKDVARFPVGAAVEGSRTDALDCTVTVSSLSVTCRSQRPGLPDGAHALIVGGQNVYMKLTNTGNAFDSGTRIFSTSVRLTNLIPQPLGVDSLGATDPDGIRIFHHVLSPNSVTVENEDGTDTFLAANQVYFQYAGNLATGDSTAPKTWQWHLPTGVETFNFKVYISAVVPKPNGWVDIYPSNDTLTSIGSTVTLVDSVRNPVGNYVPGQTVTWSSSNTGVATVDANTGVVTAVGNGTTTITAQTASPHRTGTATIVVTSASAANTTIDAAPATLTAGDSSTINVQVKNSLGNNVTTGGATVVLNASSGTLTPVTDNNDGTYTAKLVSNATGAVTVSGTLNGIAIGDSAVVNFTVGAPASMVKSAGDHDTATVNTNVAPAPAVTIKDAHNNPVPGVSVTFSVASGGGSITGGTTTTDASGVATVGSWKLGTTAGVNTLDASSPGLTTVTFTAIGTAGAPANIAKSAGDGQSATVNTNVLTAPKVLITDAFANPVGGVGVTFAPASGGGSVTGATPTTDASGFATVGSWKMGTTAGANTLTATAGALNTTFSATATPDVPANIAKTAGDLQNGTSGAAVATPPAVHVTDQYGNAVPGVTITFAVIGGGGSPTAATPTTNASGNAAVGSWTLGSGPAVNQLTATATPGGTSTPVTFTAYIPPTAGIDNSQAMGNTTLASNIAPNVLANDGTINGGAVSLVPASIGALTTVRGGTVNLAADGTFSYLPAVGITGRDSVLYSIKDTHYTGPVTSSAYIKFAFIGKVWYVENTFGGTATGRDVSPFTTVAAAEAVAGVNDTILVRTGSGATGGGTLKNGQTLRGQGHNAAFTASINSQTVTLLATGTTPNVGALTLGSGNALRGFRVFNAAGGGLTGASIGTLSLGEMSIGVTGGAALDLASGTVTGNGGTGAAVLDSVRSTNSSSVGIALSSVAGTLTVNGGTASSITNPTGSAVSISGSNPVFSFPGTISKTNAAGTGINLSSMTGGSATFSGPSIVLSTGSSAGINMSSSAATVSFVDSVKVNTTSGNGINATGGGTLTIAGTHNSVTSTTGTALNVSSTTLGAGGLNFRSISANGGSNGIVLSSTGSTAGLTVTGDGATHGSGGTIQNTTGADGASAGNGVYLSNTRSVSLSWMNLSNHGNHAIYGSEVTGIAFNRLRITGTNGSNTANDDGSIGFDNLYGSASITSSYIDGGFEDNVRVVNGLTAASASLNRLTMTSDTIGFNGNTGNDGVLIAGYGTAVVNATIQNSKFTGSRANNIQYTASENASGNIVVTGNTMPNTHPAKLGSDFGIYVAHASTGAVTYQIANNIVNNAGGSGIEVDRLAGGNGAMGGSITGNTVGTAGVAGSGSAAGAGIFVGMVGSSALGTGAVHTDTVSGNTVRQFGNYGIKVVNRGTGTNYLSVQVKNNNVAEPYNAAVTLFPTSGLRFEMGSTSGPPPDDGKSCFDISGNTLVNTGTNGAAEIRLFGRFSTKTGLPGLTGSGANALIQGQNSITTSGTAVNATSTNAFQSTCPPV